MPVQGLNERIDVFGKVSFKELRGFIRETCRVSWSSCEKATLQTVRSAFDSCKSRPWKCEAQLVKRRSVFLGYSSLVSQSRKDLNNIFS